MAALKQIAANCQFDPPEYTSQLRNVFVAGLRDDAMLQKFYEKEDFLSQTDAGPSFDVCQNAGRGPN